MLEVRSAACAPRARNEASQKSRYEVIWTAPRPAIAGPTAANASRTPTTDADQVGESPAEQANRQRKLAEELHDTADEGAGAGGEEDRFEVELRREGEEDHAEDGEVPEHWRDVADEEPAMTVEHPQAPGREDQEAGHREHVTDRAHRECEPVDRRALRRVL